MVDTRTNAPYHSKALPEGAILREWKLENVLGVGAFGIVYSARGVYFDERVAIKEYFPSAVSDRADGTTVRPTDSSAEEVYALGLRKFVEEAKILWALSQPERHPNIVSVKSLFETHGMAYIVMEFESGRSLHLKLSGRTDAYRLPSEAEWEYACRAGTKTPFSFGAVITTDQANVRGTVAYGGAAPSMVWRKATTPAGQFPPNDFGLYDMHGNVWECCEDAWNKTDEGAPTDGSAWLTGDERSRRVLRGGSWYDHPRGSRSAFRAGRNAAERGSYLGFRLARTLAPPTS